MNSALASFTSTAALTAAFCLLCGGDRISNAATLPSSARTGAPERIVHIGSLGAISSSSAVPVGPASGYYEIEPLSQVNGAVAVANSGNVAGTAITSEIKRNSPSEEWLVEKQSDGSYKLSAYCAINSLEMLDLPSGSSLSSKPAAVTGDDDTVLGATDTTQRWYLVPITRGYRIVPYSSGPSGTSTLTALPAPSKTAGGALQVQPNGNFQSQRFAFRAVATPTVLVNAKKGIPTGSSALDTGVGAMHCSWTYNWSINADSSLPASVLFVPMIFGYYGDTNVGNEMLAQNPTTKYVLGYNEPDEPNSVGGSNLTVDDALTGFQYVSALKAKGLTVGGPACAIDSDSWMTSFMSQATSSPYNYNIDFIGFHDYPSQSNVDDAAYGYLGFLDAVYNQYKLPIWATEFAPTSLSSADALTFIRIVCQGLNSRSYVQRYSMFTSESPATSGMGDSALVNSDGSLTAAGQLYARM